MFYPSTVWNSGNPVLDSTITPVLVFICIYRVPRNPTCTPLHQCGRHGSLIVFYFHVYVKVTRNTGVWWTPRHGRGKFFSLPSLPWSLPLHCRPFHHRHVECFRKRSRKLARCSLGAPPATNQCLQTWTAQRHECCLLLPRHILETTSPRHRTNIETQLCRQMYWTTKRACFRPCQKPSCSLAAPSWCRLIVFHPLRHHCNWCPERALIGWGNTDRSGWFQGGTSSGTLWYVQKKRKRSRWRTKLEAHFNTLCGWTLLTAPPSNVPYHGTPRTNLDGEMPMSKYRCKPLIIPK